MRAKLSDAADLNLGFEWLCHRVHLRPPENTEIYVTIHKVAKLQLCSSNENNFMAGAHRNMRNCIQGLEHEKGWEPLVYWIHEISIWDDDWLGNLAVILAKSLWTLRPEEDPWVPTMKPLKSSWNVCFGWSWKKGVGFTGFFLVRKLVFYQILKVYIICHNYILNQVIYTLCSITDGNLLLEGLAEEKYSFFSPIMPASKNNKYPRQCLAKC